MKTLLVWLASAFAAGIMSATYFRIPILGGSILFLFLLPCLWFNRGKKGFLLLACASFVLLGNFYSQMAGYRPPNAIESWAGTRRAYLEGTVQTQPEVKIRGKKITASFVLSSKNIAKWEKGRREFFETTGNVQVFLFQPSQIPEPGNQVRLSGSLEKPPPVLNPGGFDYGRYLSERNIYALFNGFGPRSLRITEKKQASFFIRFLFQIRLWIGRRLDILFSVNHAGLLKALILGLRSGLPSEWRDDFIKTGTAHTFTTASRGGGYDLFAGKTSFASTP